MGEKKKSRMQHNNMNINHFVYVFMRKWHTRHYYYSCDFDFMTRALCIFFFLNGKIEFKLAMSISRTLFIRKLRLCWLNWMHFGLVGIQMGNCRLLGCWRCPQVIQLQSIDLKCINWCEIVVFGFILGVLKWSKWP